jgi:SAM-dependent methyltransferase
VRTVTACPVCACSEATPVIEFNGLVLLDAMRDSPLARYDYALCHDCGLVYATRRPVGGEFTDLTDQFHECLGRSEAGSSHPLKRLGPVTPEAAEDLRRRLGPGWLVSEETPPAKDDWLPALRTDRLAQAAHLDLIASTVPLRGRRVLEIRTKTGCLLDMLRRHLGAAEAYALPMTPTQQFIIQELYGIPSEVCLNFEDLTIPYPGQFDLIIAKHMFTHSLFPDRFFALMRERLRPGGYLCLLTENDDSHMFRRDKSLLGEMKCFHFQSFDLPTLGRCLRRQGFEPTTLLHSGGGPSEMVALARLDPAAEFRPIPRNKREHRLAMFRQWRDLSVLGLPVRVRSAFGEDLPVIEQRALAEGYAYRTLTGFVRPARKLAVTHEDGYADLNDRAVEKRLKGPRARKPLSLRKRGLQLWERTRHILGRV